MRGSVKETLRPWQPSRVARSKSSEGGMNLALEGSGTDLESSQFWHQGHVKLQEWVEKVRARLPG
jgi:hypothetical protein